MKRLTDLCFLLLLFYFCVSCAQQEQEAITTIFTGNAMTIDYKVIIGAKLSEKQQILAQKKIREVFEEVNAVYNKYNPESELSHINQLKANEKTVLSPQLEMLLKLAGEIAIVSEGRFDPAIEPIQKVWRSKLEQGNLPSQSEIAEAARSAGWDKLHFSDGVIFKDHDSTSLDLGGIAKGYCVDLLVEGLNSLGFPDLYVEWGGEIRASGRHPSNRPWTIFISRLGDTDPSKALAILPLNEEAIATSGDYLQNWTVRNPEDGSSTTYFHIFDPRSALPLKTSAKSIASASVKAPTCALADGLATAAMMFDSVEAAQEWAERIQSQNPKITFWFATK